MIKINAYLRESFGTNSSRKLRTKNFLPSIIYGKKKSVILIVLSQHDIVNLFNKHSLKEKSLLIILKNQKIKVIIKDIQKHPFKYKFLHIDFLRV
ncbi:50S ribosomal protein L25 [Buchnera aphidicola]|uniref:50S ribosomal protein L25 n=1 Tax=Buchnera aphidicola TaxID=9 RepID=UPI00346423AC